MMCEAASTEALQNRSLLSKPILTNRQMSNDITVCWEKYSEITKALRVCWVKGSLPLPVPLEQV